MPATGLGPAPGFRILQGESCGWIFWSNNSGISLNGTFRIVYDSGHEENFDLLRQSSAVTRVAEMARTARVAKENGYVIGLSIGVSASSPVQRGQVYAVAWIMRGPSPTAQDVGAATSGTMPLAAGYVWTYHPLLLGVYIEAGPAGGHGHMRLIDLGDPAAGADYPSNSSTVPTGAIWRPVGFRGSLTTDATVANRLVAMDLDDGTGTYGGFGPATFNVPATASVTHNYRGAIGMVTGVGSNGGRTGFPIPQVFPPPGHRISVI